MSREDFIAKLAEHLVNTNSRMSFSELAKYLNRNGHRNNIGHKYKRARGIGKLVKTIYDSLIAQGKNTEAHNVATAFVKEDGTYAYK